LNPASNRGREILISEPAQSRNTGSIERKGWCKRIDEYGMGAEHAEGGCQLDITFSKVAQQSHQLR
jgi:hypothetical protein